MILNMYILNIILQTKARDSDMPPLPYHTETSFVAITLFKIIALKGSLLALRNLICIRKKKKSYLL